MSFFSRLTDLAAAAARSVSETVVSAAAAMNLDALQDEGAARREAYAGLDITYLTPRVAVMTFPAYPNSRARSRNDAGAVAALLAERHGAQAMLWNLSEESYDGALWGGCVVAAEQTREERRRRQRQRRLGSVPAPPPPPPL